MKRVLTKILLPIFSQLVFFTAEAQEKDTTKAVSIGPIFLNYNLAPGRGEIQRFYILNRYNYPLTFELKAIDFSRDTFGRITYSNRDSTTSCKSWINVGTDFVTVPPRSKTTVEVALQVPKNETSNSMKWAMVLASSVIEGKVSTDSASNKKMKINQSLGVGIQIFQTPPGLTKDIKMLSFKALNNNTYRIACQNTGGAQIEGDFSIEITSSQMKEKKRIHENEVKIFPGQVRYVDLKLPEGLPKGKYNAVAMIDAGDDVPLEAAQLVIEVK